MASILRSSKFVRYIAGFAKNVVVSTPGQFDGTLVNSASTQCFCGALPRSFASQTASHHELESRIKSLDQDVRKSGRISRRDIEDILEEIRNTRSATSSQSLLVIRCCGTLVPEELPEVRTKLVQEIWNTLNTLKVPMDVSHYNALLRVYLENEHNFSPAKFLSNMESKGIEPNRVTYQRLIAKYCQDGDIEGATKILEYMREKQMPVNENVFNALIVGHSQAGDMDSAQGILSVMAQAGLEASADTFTTLLCGYAKTGNLDKILQIMEECEAKEIFLLDKDYLDIVYALATNGHHDKIHPVLNKVRKSIGYNQDAINMILRLINKNQDETAFEIMKTMIRSTRPDGSQMPIGSFFIRQLVKADKPVEKIIQYCNRLDQEGMYDRGIFYAAEVSLELGNEKLAYQLFKELQQNGQEIRQHYFWPLLTAKAKDKSGKEIVRVLQKMQEFDITPSSETLREYVLPHLNGNSADILAKLREANISLGTSASSLVVVLLFKGNIAEAATIASSVTAYYPPELVKKPLTKAFYSTNDLESYVTILRAVHDNFERRSAVYQNPTELDQAELVGQFLHDLALNITKFLNVVVPVLTRVVKEGLTISTSSAQKIEAKLGEKMTEEISDLLGRLTSGELTPVERVKHKSPIYVPSEKMNPLQLETLIKNLDAKGGDTKGLKRRLWTLYYFEKNLEKIEPMLEAMKNTDYVMTTGMYAQLMDCYVHHDNLEKALEYFKVIQQEDFKLDPSKIVRLAHLMSKSGKFDDAVKLLEDFPSPAHDPETPNYGYSSQVWRFLNYLAEEGRVDDLNKVFNVLAEKEMVEINTGVLGPLVKVHLIRKELDKALEKFEWCISKYKCTPWKHELACQLIQIEDAEKLQKLTDLSTTVHGEINSLYDLVFSFVECGRIRQARKILETPGMQSRPQRINSACERFSSEGMVKPLEDLRDATKDLNHIDRTDIYHQLLLTYIKQDDPEKCLGLWTQMQEEDLAPSEEFLTKLGRYLQKKNLKVPFVMPDTVKREPGQTKREPEVLSDRNAFRKNLRSGNLDDCLKILEKTNEAFSATDLSALVEKLVQNERLTDATNLTIAILDNGMVPVQKYFKFLLNKLAIAGDVESIKIIGSKIDSNLKKLVSFDNKVCQAHLAAGKGESYLQNLESEIDNAKEENLQSIGESFPRGGACGILERYPEWTDKYEQVALKYAKRGILGPLNVLWSHYFINHNFDKADQIWKDHLVESNRIMFQRIVQGAREKKDVELAKRLIDHLKKSKVTEGALGNAYSCLFDVLVAEERNEEIVEIFENAVTDVKIDLLNRTAVQRVKSVYEKLGKEFKYEIPPKKASPKKEEEESY